MSTVYINASRFHPMERTERRIFFDRYLHLPSPWIPQRLGSHEPLRKFDSTNWHEMLPSTREYGLLWSRSRPSVSGHLIATIDRDPSEWLTMSLERAAISDDQIIDSAAFITDIFAADILSIHILSEREAINCRKLQVARPDPFKKEADWSCSIPSHRYAFGIPHLGWATFFGPVYIRHFGLDKLLSAPAPIVRQTGDSHVLVQFATTFHEVDSDWDRFNATRDAVLDHLGRESFQRPRIHPDDPPPMYELDQNGVPATSIPPELVSWRRELESQYAKRRDTPSIFD